MALQFLKLFQPSQLANAAALIYQVPTSPSTALLRNGRVRLTNTTGSPVAVTLYAVPASGSSSATNEFFPAVSVPANSAPVDVDLPQMSAGDALWGFAGSTTSVSIAAMDGVLQS